MEQIEARTHFCLGMSFQVVTCLPVSDLQVEAFALALCREVQMKRRVLIACGYRANAIGTIIEKIAELMHVPILTSFDGKGTVDERHPLSYGVVGMYGNAGTSG
jgi:thiamine pyrophosphate-dependent acetolactate synthase large subunit-like protein